MMYLSSTTGEWITLSKKRQVKSRTFEMKVAGVGTVQILNSNNYTLEEGEPGVAMRELRACRTSAGNTSGTWNTDEDSPSREVFIPQVRRVGCRGYCVVR